MDNKELNSTASSFSCDLDYANQNKLAQSLKATFWSTPANGRLREMQHSKVVETSTHKGDPANIRRIIKPERIVQRFLFYLGCNKIPRTRPQEHLSRTLSRRTTINFA